MKIFIVIASLFIGFQGFSQCKSGDCLNGKGTFDYGWCVYQGEFKNGKPEGIGTMKYDDYSYTGQFKNGVEDGNGIITYKNSNREKTLYHEGKKINFEPIEVAEKDFKPLEGQPKDCISGNCLTGFGTVVFPDGNKYEGNFVNKKRQGQGTFYFASGDVFHGDFNADLISFGTYTFQNGYSFTGNWGTDGKMRTGTYYSPAGTSVKMVDGKIVVPNAEEILKKEQLAQNARDACAEKVKCIICKGKKVVSNPIVTTGSWTVPATRSIDRYGNVTTEYASQSSSYRSVIPNFEYCSACNGMGTVCRAANKYKD